MGRPGQKRDRLTRFSRLQSSLDQPDSAAFAERLPSQFDARRPEASYAEVISADHRRELGQFFTPPDIAELMCHWLWARRPATLLDPAVGPGALLRTFLQEQPSCQATAIDLDPLALQALERTLIDPAAVRILRADFLTWKTDDCFDAIIANPPYLRHHDLAYDQDIHEAVGRRNHVAVSRLTNAYGLFVLEICRRLNPGGRAAVIVPGEWLNANFGRPMKQFLLEHGLLQILAYFSHAQSVFHDALTTASLLFLERKPAQCTPSVVTAFVDSPHCLDDLRRLLDGRQATRPGLIVRRFSADLLQKTAKWNALLQSGASELPPGFVPLGSLAQTRRGIATGANKFFHVAPSLIARHALGKTVGQACVGRASDVQGLVFSKENFRALGRRDRRSQLLCFQGELDGSARDYVKLGEQAGLHQRFLLSRREPWYAMEHRRPAPIWAAVFGRKQLRFVWNQAGVLNLTTFHGVYPVLTDVTSIKALVACLNSRSVRTLAKAQQRVYGGGLLKFEPNDLLQIPTPNLAVASAQCLRRLAHLLDALHTAIQHARPTESLHRQLDQAVHQAANEAQAPSSPGPD